MPALRLGHFWRMWTAIERRAASYPLLTGFGAWLAATFWGVPAASLVTTVASAIGALLLGLIQGFTQARVVAFVGIWVGLNLAFWAVAMISGMPILWLGVWLSQRVRIAGWATLIIGIFWLLAVRSIGAIWILMHFAELNAVWATGIVVSIWCVEFTSRTIGRGSRFRAGHDVTFAYELRDRAGRSLTSSNTFGPMSMAYSNGVDAEFDSAIVRKLDGRRRGFKTVMHDIDASTFPGMDRVPGPMELSIQILDVSRTTADDV